MGTSLRSAARISAVGASKRGLTSTNHRSPAKGRRCRSRGSQLLQAAKVRGGQAGRQPGRRRQLDVTAVRWGRRKGVRQPALPAPFPPRAHPPDEDEASHEGGGNVVGMVPADRCL